MKNAITRILILLFAVCTYAQQGINYKAIIKDDSGNIFSSSPVTIQFIIYEGAALTSNVYQETHTTTTDANGIVIINIGEGTIGVSGIFDAIDWGIDAHFLNTQIDNGAGLVDMGTIGFKTVPYALHAENGIPSGGTEGQVLTIVDGNIVWTSSTGCLDNFYADTDGDGYGDPNGLVMACFAPTGYVLDNTDCDDTNSAINPDANEVCDGVDNNCSGGIDEGFDLDGDGVTICQGDCDDTEPSTNPVTDEICGDGVDNNCNGEIDEECGPAAIGDFRRGGIVFWVDPEDNTHGLIVALTGSVPGSWGCNNTDLPNVPNVTGLIPSGPGAEIGDGMSNTNSILNDCPTSQAALAARSLGPQWFLPSVNELVELTKGNTSGYGGMNFYLMIHGGEEMTQNLFYSSSTEHSFYESYIVLFTFNEEGGVPSETEKLYTREVRAIRAF